MKKKSSDKPVFPELPGAEVADILKKIGVVIRTKRKELSGLENFAHEIGIARSTMTRIEDGLEMNVGTLLKVLYGLGITLEEFSKELKKNEELSKKLKK